MKLKKINSDIVIIFGLGLVCGLPIAMLLSTLKVFLVDLHIDIKTIGAFSLLSLPYSLKFLWAPVLDSVSLPFLTQRFGKRRAWMILTQILLFILIAFLGVVGIGNNLWAIFIVACLIAITSATQDMAVDAYRIETIKPEDQGLAATFYVYGYRLGMLVSGAGALYLSSKTSWQLVYLNIASVMLFGVAVTLLAKENLQLIETIQKSQRTFMNWLKTSMIEPLSELLRRKNWYIIFPFVIAFKLCDAFSGSLTLPFLLDVGFSKVEIAVIVKTFGLCATLVGALIGGILVKRVGLMKSLWVAAILQMLSNLAFSYQASVGHNIPVLYLAIFAENFSGGIGDTIFIAYLSSLCNKTFAATDYAILVSFASLGRSLFSSTAGYFAAYFGWVHFFFFSTLLGLPALILLFFLRKNLNQTEQIL